MVRDFAGFPADWPGHLNSDMTTDPAGDTTRVIRGGDTTLPSRAGTPGSGLPSQEGVHTFLAAELFVYKFHRIEYFLYIFAYVCKGDISIRLLSVTNIFACNFCILAYIKLHILCISIDLNFFSKFCICVFSLHI